MLAWQASVQCPRVTYFNLIDPWSPGPILEVPIEEIRTVYDTNILSVLRVSRAVVPHMASRKSGLIVNIGSIVGEM
jgi:NADP-dependent 3-hydroxy acid dehydrogenase YdfG